MFLSTLIACNDTNDANVLNFELISIECNYDESKNDPQLL